MVKTPRVGTAAIAWRGAFREWQGCASTPRVEMFDDHVPGGFRITYVIDEEHERILVVRIRKALRRD